MSVDIREYTDLEIIEECFKAPHCESTHQQSKRCSHTPVAGYFVSCMPELGYRKVCQVHVDRVLQNQRDGISHAVCQRPVSECWILGPLPA